MVCLPVPYLPNIRKRKDSPSYDFLLGPHCFKQILYRRLLLRSGSFFILASPITTFHKNTRKSEIAIQQTSASISQDLGYAAPNSA